MKVLSCQKCIQMKFKHHELFSQKPLLRSLARSWLVFAGRKGFLMFSEGKKQTSDIKLFTMLSKTDIHWSSKLKCYFIQTQNSIFSKTSPPWSHLRLESSPNFITYLLSFKLEKKFSVHTRRQSGVLKV